MIRKRRLLILSGVMIIAALLAFPLRIAIYETIVIPLAYLAWELGLVYRSLPQIILWWVAIALAFVPLILGSLPRSDLAKRDESKSKPRRGQVEDLAIWLGRARVGVYFKWLIANRLGKLAFQILVHRENGRSRSVFAPLLGLDWEPSKELQKYLETGLHGSFSDYPTPRRPLATPAKTPLDYEVNEAVLFLEAQIENSHLPRSQ